MISLFFIYIDFVISCYRFSRIIIKFLSLFRRYNDNYIIYISLFYIIISYIIFNIIIFRIIFYIILSSLIIITFIILKN